VQISDATHAHQPRSLKVFLYSLTSTRQVTASRRRTDFLMKHRHRFVFSIFTSLPSALRSTSESFSALKKNLNRLCHHFIRDNVFSVLATVRAVKFRPISCLNVCTVHYVTWLGGVLQLGWSSLAWKVVVYGVLDRAKIDASVAA